MPDDGPASARILLQMVKAYQCRHRGATMSEFSRHILEGNRQLLAQWTNPGTRINWRIPLARVTEVAARLGATPAQSDALMQARLNEVQAEGDRHGVPETVAWLCDLFSRTQHEEQWLVLDAFDQAWAKETRQIDIPLHDHHRALLVELFTRFLRDAHSEYLAEDRALGTVSPERMAELKASYLRGDWKLAYAKRRKAARRTPDEAIQGIRVSRINAMKATDDLIRRAKAVARREVPRVPPPGEEV